MSFFANAIATRYRKMRLKTKTLETVLHETVEREKKKKKEFGVVSLFGERVREWVFIERRKEKRRRKARELRVFACSSKENI